MDEPRWIERLRRGSNPLAPLPTEVEPRLALLPGIRAVLFDIYGTLVISGSGEVGAADPGGRDDAVIEALDECGARWLGPPAGADQLLRETIQQHLQRRRGDQAPAPEVDIVAVWRDVAGELLRRGWIGAAPAPLKDLVIAHELRANPVWPMPEAQQVLAELRRRGLRLGVVSNAQFYTPLVFPALLDASLEQLGVAPADQQFSYLSGRAKPDCWMFRQAAGALSEDHIQPREALYVGNDMLNDIAGAAAVGFRTALFAGDRRSLRLRESDPRANAVPDLILQRLGQLLDCLAPLKETRT